jgi:hypothetical protein
LSILTIGLVTAAFAAEEKRGRESFAGTARRVLRTKDSRPLFSELFADALEALADQVGVVDLLGRFEEK